MTTSIKTLAQQQQQQHKDDHRHTFTRPSWPRNRRNYPRAERLVDWLTFFAVVTGMTLLQVKAGFLPAHYTSPHQQQRRRQQQQQPHHLHSACFSAGVTSPQLPPHRRRTSVWMGLRAYKSSSSSSSYPFDLKQRPGESRADYMKRLGQAAAAQATPAPAGWETSHRADDDDAAAHSDPQPKKKGYQRVEEWEQEQQEELAKQKQTSWEERVQFDGQRHGNRFAQNEILRRNLKLW